MVIIGVLSCIILYSEDRNTNFINNQISTSEFYNNYAICIVDMNFSI